MQAAPLEVRPREDWASRGTCSDEAPILVGTRPARDAGVRLDRAAVPSNHHRLSHSPQHVSERPQVLYEELVCRRGMSVYPYVSLCRTHPCRLAGNPHVSRQDGTAKGYWLTSASTS